VAHFINRLVFFMFAEDADLLPNKMFGRMLQAARPAPNEFKPLASALSRQPSIRYRSVCPISAFSAASCRRT